MPDYCLLPGAEFLSLTAMAGAEAPNPHPRPAARHSPVDHPAAVLLSLALLFPQLVEPSPAAQPGPFLFPREVAVSAAQHRGWFPASEGHDKSFLWWCLQGMKCANAMQITLMKQPNVLGLCPKNIPHTWLWCSSLISSSCRPDHLQIDPFSSRAVLWHSWSWLESRGQYLA